MLRWIQLCLFLNLSKSMFFELLVLFVFVLYLVGSVSAEVSFNCIFRILFMCPFFYFEKINIRFVALIPLALHSFPPWFVQFQQMAPWIVLLTCCLVCVHFVLHYHSVQLSHTWSDFSHLLRVMILKLEFCVTSFSFIILLSLLLLTLMKQLTWNVDIIPLIRIFGLDI